MEMKAIATKRDEVVLRAFEAGVQPPVAAHPGGGAFNHPADAGRNELSVAPASYRLDGDAELLAGLGPPVAPIAEIAQCRALEAAIGELTQNRHDTLRVMPVRRRDVDRQRRRGRDWLSMTTALGSGESPKVRRQVGLPVKHPAPRAERVQRANCP